MFLQEPHYAVYGDDGWVLTRALIYFSTLLDQRIEAPQGFHTDLASVPRFFQRVFPVVDRHRHAATLHDYLYSIKGALPNGRQLTRLECDQVFLEAMQLSGVPAWKRHTMYRAVRLAGGAYWNSK